VRLGLHLCFDVVCDGLPPMVVVWDVARDASGPIRFVHHQHGGRALMGYIVCFVRPVLRIVVVWPGYDGGHNRPLVGIAPSRSHTNAFPCSHHGEAADAGCARGMARSGRGRGRQAARSGRMIRPVIAAIAGLPRRSPPMCSGAPRWQAHGRAVPRRSFCPVAVEGRQARCRWRRAERGLADFRRPRRRRTQGVADEHGGFPPSIRTMPVLTQASDRQRRRDRASRLALRRCASPSKRRRFDFARKRRRSAPARVGIVILRFRPCVIVWRMPPLPEAGFVDQFLRIEGRRPRGGRRPRSVAPSPRAFVRWRGPGP